MKKKKPSIEEIEAIFDKAWRRLCRNILKEEYKQLHVMANKPPPKMVGLDYYLRKIEGKASRATAERPSKRKG